MHVPGFLRFPALVRTRSSESVSVSLVHDGRAHPDVELPASIFSLVAEEAGLVELVVVPGATLGGSSKVVELHGADGWWGKGKRVMRGVFERGELLSRDEETARVFLGGRELALPIFAFAHVEPGPFALGAFTPNPHEARLGPYDD